MTDDPVTLRQTPADCRWLAEYLHDEYERIARRVGWDTQDGTSVPFDELPEENREVMLRLAASLLSSFRMEIALVYLRLDYRGELPPEEADE